MMMTIVIIIIIVRSRSRQFSKRTHTGHCYRVRGRPKTVQFAAFPHSLVSLSHAKKRKDWILRPQKKSRKTHTLVARLAHTNGSSWRDCDVFFLANGRESYGRPENNEWWYQRHSRRLAYPCYTLITRMRFVHELVPSFFTKKISIFSDPIYQHWQFSLYDLHTIPIMKHMLAPNGCWYSHNHIN